LGGLAKGIGEVAMGGAFGIFWGAMSGILLCRVSRKVRIYNMHAIIMKFWHYFIEF
jgi:hypothetical protein